MCCKECKELEAFEESFSEGKPYIEEVYDGYIIRTFDSGCPVHYLKWHYDEEDRNVTPLNKNDWKFQFDNEIPIPINGTINIKSGIYHRVIKGTTKLIVKIEKL
jgi:hypothetical protein